MGPPISISGLKRGASAVLLPPPAQVKTSKSDFPPNYLYIRDPILPDQSWVEMQFCFGAAISECILDGPSASIPRFRDAFADMGG